MFEYIGEAVNFCFTLKFKNFLYFFFKLEILLSLYSSFGGTKLEVFRPLELFPSLVGEVLFTLFLLISLTFFGQQLSCL